MNKTPKPGRVQFRNPLFRYNRAQLLANNSVSLKELEISENISPPCWPVWCVLYHRVLVVSRKLTVSHLVIRKHPPTLPQSVRLRLIFNLIIERALVFLHLQCFSSSQIYFHHFVSSKLIPFCKWV